MSIYCSPLRYPGGKNCIFPFLSNLFYENHLIGSNYAEPYAGGAGLALRLLFEGYVERVYINDLDRSVYCFWKSVLERTDELCAWIREIEISVDNWRKYKTIFENSESEDEFEIAKSTFFLNRTNVSGVLRGGIIGGFEQKGKYKIDARFNKEDLIERIERIADSKNRIFLSNLDGLSFVKGLDKKKREDIFIYLDPPYYQKGADLYMNFYSQKDHKELAKYVHRLKKRWMVSYDNHDFILKLYSSNHRVMYKLSQSASNRVGDEILVFSEGLDFYSSLKTVNSPVLIETT